MIWMAVEVVVKTRDERQEAMKRTGYGYQRVVVGYVLLVGMLILMGCQAEDRFSDEPDPVDDRQEIREPAPEPEPQVHHATLAAVGDILLHRSILRDAAVGETFDFQKMFAPVKPYLERADITVANQESLMGGRELGLSGYPMFNSPFEIGDTLKWAGIDVVVMANNHTLDRGEEGVLRSIDRWDELGMVYVGANKNEADARRLRLLERNGIVFSFLAYTYGTNGIPIPEGKPYLVNLIDRQRIRDDVAHARAHSDVVVVSLHFGQEYERMPNDEQRALVQFVADQGAHVILGHHPHVLQPVEFVRSALGHDAFVIYSLGNFLAAQDHIYRQLGGIVQVEIEKTVHGDAVDIRMHSPAFLPTYIHFKNWRGYVILPLAQVTASQLPNVEKVDAELRLHMGQYVPQLHWMSAGDATGP